MPITALFPDIGGVLLANGWDHQARRRAAIHKFELDGLAGSFISSCFVHVRKPDAEILRLALDIAQVPARQVVYIENTPMFVQIAEGLGIRSILHTDYSSAAKPASGSGRSQPYAGGLQSLGVELDEAGNAAKCSGDFH